jgi:hypothetical protein
MTAQNLYTLEPVLFLIAQNARDKRRYFFLAASRMLFLRAQYLDKTPASFCTQVTTVYLLPCQEYSL